MRDSAGLSAAQRRANLADTFLRTSSERAPGVLHVLVDDVVTSGATLTEAAAVLSAGRAPADPPVLAAVVAATPRNRPENVPMDPVDRLSGAVRRD